MPQSRQLAAIMFTDIVGYSALMGNDQQHGQWIKEIGDGTMASFNTVSDAVLN